MFVSHGYGAGEARPATTLRTRSQSGEPRGFVFIFSEDLVSSLNCGTRLFEFVYLSSVMSLALRRYRRPWRLVGVSHRIFPSAAEESDSRVFGAGAV